MPVYDDEETLPPITGGAASRLNPATSETAKVPLPTATQLLSNAAMMDQRTSGSTIPVPSTVTPQSYSPGALAPPASTPAPIPSEPPSSPPTTRYTPQEYPFNASRFPTMRFASNERDDLMKEIDTSIYGGGHVPAPTPTPTPPQTPPQFMPERFVDIEDDRLNKYGWSGGSAYG